MKEDLTALFVALNDTREWREVATLRQKYINSNYINVDDIAFNVGIDILDSESKYK